MAKDQRFPRADFMKNYLLSVLAVASVWIVREIVEAYHRRSRQRDRRDMRRAAQNAEPS